jgi:DNA-directed RNA polymerase subunit RPC12/RpoP
MLLAESGVDCRTYFRQNGEQATFDCQHCEKKFLLKSYLTLHMKKHSNLTCGKCNVTFKNKFNLKWHEFSHLEIEPKCTNCAVNFTSEQKFAIHLKKKICVGNNVIVNGNAE